jgi:GNAT superfamily N-acetyltransferase
MEILRSLLKKIIKFFYYERVVLYGYDLRVRHDFESKTDMRVGKASLQDVEKLYQDELNGDIKSIPLEVWKEKISKELWKGFILIDDNTIVAQAFYSVEDVFVGGTKRVLLNLPSESAYGFKLFTRPDYRGRKLGQVITSFRLNNAKKEGVKRFYTIIYADNVVSRHNEEKIGGYLVGSIIFLECRFFNNVFFTPGIRREGFTVKEIRDF